MRNFLVGLVTVAIIAAFVFGAIGTADGVKRQPAGDNISIVSAWARAPVTPDSPAAAYMTFVNRSHQPERVLTLSSPAAAHVEIHNSRGGKGMVPVSHLELPPTGKVALEPGGLHIMLTRIHQPLIAGGTVQLEVTFEHSGRQIITLPVEPMGSLGPDSNDHHH